MAKEIIYHCDGCERVIRADEFIVEMVVQEKVTKEVTMANGQKGSVSQLDVQQLHACQACWLIMNSKTPGKDDDNAEQLSLED